MAQSQGVQIGLGLAHPVWGRMCTCAPAVRQSRIVTEIRLTCINAHPSLLLLLFPLCFFSLYLFVLSPTFCVDASLVTFFGLTNNQTGQQLHKTDVNQSGEIDVKDFELAIEVSTGAERMRRGVMGGGNRRRNKNQNQNKCW